MAPGPSTKTTQGLSAPDLHVWASQQLGISPSASARAARAAFMNRLAEYQWVPPPAIQESYEYWSQSDGPLLPSLVEQAFQDEEYRLRAQIEEFAQNFFELHVEARQNRYKELSDQCAWSVSLSARLGKLAAGLDVSRADWQNAPTEQQELAEQVCQLFTLPAAEEARRRWQLLQELESPRCRA